MATTIWSSWNDYVLPNVPGVLPALAQHHVKMAAIDFLERAKVWRYDHDPITVAANVAEYDWSPPNASAVVEARDLYFAGKQLHPKTPDQLTEIYGGDWRAAKGSPQFFITITLRKFRIVPIPQASVSMGLKALVIIKPKRAATGIDSNLFEDWADEIADGAMGTLFAMKRKPWSDPALSAYHTGRFDAAINKALMQGTRGFNRARLRTRAYFI